MRTRWSVSGGPGPAPGYGSDPAAELVAMSNGRHLARLIPIAAETTTCIDLGPDPDSRAMAAHTRVAVGYNAQVAVDAKNKMIVEQAVTNQVVDMGLLTQTAEPARDILGVETIDVVADRGYFKIEDIEACEKAHCIPHVPKPQRKKEVHAWRRHGRYGLLII